MEPYDHKAIEPKWQQAWSDAKAFEVQDMAGAKDKAYILDMFPYPSGYGLHVGHLLGYTGSDIVSRYLRLKGKTVLHPFGWDAFGLPAENFAIKSGVHPAISTESSVKEYRRQLTQAGMSYDWSKEINTTLPEYYKWTQWLFSLLYKKGLAYRKEGMVNWCSNCQTVLANEQVVSGQCERCGTVVTQKQLKQWYFRITDYAERLLEDMEGLDWPERIKAMQKNWIGKSEGALLTFKVKDTDISFEVFTTRPDTLFGATYAVVAPEHAILASVVPESHMHAVKAYQEEVSKKTELERTFLEREKTGVFTGAYVTNAATGKDIPLWTADYVLSTYGTGAVMGVPAHDERDFEFATAFDLPIVEVIEGEGDLPRTAKGRLLNSAEFTGKEPSEAVPAILAKVGGQTKTTYRLRDWLVSRQRFWGSPIPIAYDEDGNEYLLPEQDLPVTLPMDVDFLPTGQSPLAVAEDWQRYESDGKVLRREADTLDTFVCSSWYYLRYVSPKLQDKPFDADLVAKWLPVDTYIGGAEHAVLHLLYSRFITKVLYDEGLVPFKEPFASLRNQGMILGPDHNKMSKSKGNVINPDDVIAEYGADALRVYEMFMAPFELEKPWSTTGIVGVRRFLEKVWKLRENLGDEAPTAAEAKAIAKAVKKVGEDIEDMKFNTAVSTMMEAANALSSQPKIALSTYRDLIRILNPFAPHLSEELWSITGGEGLCSLSVWPGYDEAATVDHSAEYPVQINGKVRFKVEVMVGASQEEVLQAVKAHERYVQSLEGFELIKEIVVPGRLVSLVVRPKS